MTTAWKNYYKSFVVAAAGSLLFVSACSSKLDNQGYPSGDSPRVATEDHPVVIAYPIESQPVDSPFVILGEGTAFKGILEYEIVDQSDTVVDSGETLTGSMGAISNFSIQADLDPGQYTVELKQWDSPDRATTTEPFTTSMSFTVQ